MPTATKENDISPVFLHLESRATRQNEARDVRFYVRLSILDYERHERPERHERHERQKASKMAKSPTRRSRRSNTYNNYSFPLNFAVDEHFLSSKIRGVMQDGI